MIVPSELPYDKFQAAIRTIIEQQDILEKLVEECGADGVNRFLLCNFLAVHLEEEHSFIRSHKDGMDFVIYLWETGGKLKNEPE